MAFGSSMPELLTSVIGAIHSGGKIAIGSIAGSAVFKLIFVIAVSSLAVKEQIRWKQYAFSATSYEVI